MKGTGRQTWAIESDATADSKDRYRCRSTRSSMLCCVEGEVKSNYGFFRAMDEEMKQKITTSKRDRQRGRDWVSQTPTQPSLSAVRE